jgi:hypothetical protein
MRMLGDEIIEQLLEILVSYLRTVERHGAFSRITYRCIRGRSGKCNPGAARCVDNVQPKRWLLCVLAI